MPGLDDLGTAALIHETLSEMNETRGPGRAIPTAPDTVLIGDAGVLDSLGFVTLAVMLEKRIEQTLSAQISVFEIVVAGDDQWTVASLAEAIGRRVSDVGAAR